MTTELALLADLRSRGIEIETDGQRLRWRPTFLVNAREVLLIQLNREALIKTLSNSTRIPQCPTCARPMDNRRRCPNCFDRPCTKCGRMTGSYFIQMCFQCASQDEIE